jgi:hypothetical protein
LIVFDASSVVGAALKSDSVTERALHRLIENFLRLAACRYTFAMWYITVREWHAGREVGE